MPNPLKVYIERVEKTEAVRLTEETLDDFRRQFEVMSYRLDNQKGEITFAFEWHESLKRNPLVVPWGDYVVVTYVRESNRPRYEVQFQVVPFDDFEAKFTEDTFPLTYGEMEFLKHLYAKDVAAAREAQAIKRLPRDRP